MLRTGLASATIAATFVTASGTARADDTATLGVGPSLAGMSAIDLVGSVDVAVSWRRPNADRWLRVAVAAGVTTAVDEGEGAAYQVRVGIEHRPSDCWLGCVYYGVDLAYVRGHMDDDPESANLSAVMAIPRIGISLGDERTRLRLGFEVPLGIGRVHEVQPELAMPVDTTSTDFVGGFTFATSFVFAVD